MNRLIKNQEEWAFHFANHQIEMLQIAVNFNKNHEAKVLMGHIETYKACIENLLEERTFLKEIISKDIANS